MAETKTKTVKKKKIKISGVIFILVVIAIIVLVVRAFFNLPIKHIYITGNSYVTDHEIIMAAGIKDYPAIYKLSTKKLKNKILENPLIKDVKIKRNLSGKLTISVVEDKVLFLNRSKNTLVINVGNEIPNNYSYTKIPILINHVPDDLYEELITGLYKVDYDIVSSISEIEYSPTKNEKGETIDATRFYLRMNDGNAVIMNTVNIKRLNKYNTIYASIGDQKGTIHLDSMMEDSIYFKSFELEKEEQAEKEAEENEGDPGTEN